MIQTALTAIPQPPPSFLLKNLRALQAQHPVQDMMALARTYGPIYRLDMRHRVLLVVSGHALVHELCDDQRFDKSIRGALGLVRRFAGDGLFTARTQEPNWARAHNILLPNFGQRAMQGYHAMMLDIAEQLVRKWERLGADEDIDVSSDMTRLTVDTIALCGFHYRFNSFYHDTEHPFVRAMASALRISMDELQDLPLERWLRQRRQRQLRRAIEQMNVTVDRIIQERRASGAAPTAQADLLGYMLHGVDTHSGERLDDLNIRYQIITFLIAGHETTSGLLSFALYALLSHPEVLARAYEEVDRVLGPDRQALPTYAQVNQLAYLRQILQETLRLWPTAPVYAVAPHEDTVIGGRYLVPRHTQINILLPMLHRDPQVWGAQADVFNPDHFTAEAEAARPINAYKPFGNGQRSCIGRQFALQEATLVLGMILHRFTLLDHTHYQLKIKETLTLKPEGFRMQVRLRTPEARVNVPVSTTLQTPRPMALSAAPGPSHATPLLVLYGSNMGTAEGLARQMAHEAEAAGFVTRVAALDAYAGRLPDSGWLWVVTASYNGLPPDNAVQFCAWLQRAEPASVSLAGLRYVVFGCGHRDWAATFQAIPRLIDARLAALGATRLYQRGEGDAREDFDGQFQQWYQAFRATVATELGLRLETLDSSRTPPLYEIDIVAGTLPHPLIEAFDVVPLTVCVQRELQRQDGPQPSTRSTRHLELALPAAVSYRAGGHLGVLPRNSARLVARVAARFGLAPDTVLRIRTRGQRKTWLPLEAPITLAQVLSRYVEVQEVATRAQVQTLLAYTTCASEQATLAALAGDDAACEARYKSMVLAPRISVLDLLEACPACSLPLAVYLELLPPLRPRYYSISSSPLAVPRRCSLTVAVVQGPARSGHGVFEGVCSTYLSRQQEGDVIEAFIKEPPAAFRLPDDPATPLIMIGPGTGLAPFRGFLQERAALQAQGVALGQALLFFGCRHPQQDYLYEEELQRFVAQGVTALVVAFSRLAGQEKRYVQDEISAHHEAVWQLLEAGAVVYVCGDASRMAPAVRATFAALYQEHTGADAAAAEHWLQTLTAQQRYCVDVWAAS
ncbi:MAG: bifunctional cytochrome P450/NADPH--P450 reductase [Candidatus Tectimicrobiota bacterium]